MAVASSAGSDPTEWETGSIGWARLDSGQSVEVLVIQRSSQTGLCGCVVSSLFAFGWSLEDLGADLEGFRDLWLKGSGVRSTESRPLKCIIIPLLMDRRAVVEKCVRFFSSTPCFETPWEREGADERFSGVKKVGSDLSARVESQSLMLGWVEEALNKFTLEPKPQGSVREEPKLTSQLLAGCNQKTQKEPMDLFGPATTRSDDSSGSSEDEEEAADLNGLFGGVEVGKGEQNTNPSQVRELIPLQIVKELSRMDRKSARSSDSEVYSRGGQSKLRSVTRARKRLRKHPNRAVAKYLEWIKLVLVCTSAE